MRGTADTSLRVLVVDDNQDTAENLAFFIRTWGHDARTAHDGPSAIATALRFRPEAIVLDIGLPVVDGFEVARRLRAHPELGGALIVAASGYNGEADRRHAAECGIDFYLAKPFDPCRLERLLDSHFSAQAVPA